MHAEVEVGIHVHAYTDRDVHPQALYRAEWIRAACGWPFSGSTLQISTPHLSVGIKEKVLETSWRGPYLCLMLWHMLVGLHEGVVPGSMVGWAQHSAYI